MAEDRTNMLYVAPERLRRPGLERRARPGAGSFDGANDRHRLTAGDAPSPSHWALPLDFLPRGRPPLAYHDDASRWSRQGGEARLCAVAKGQKLVLDLDQYAGVAEWATRLIAASGPTARSRDAIRRAPHAGRTIAARPTTLGEEPLLDHASV